MNLTQSQRTTPSSAVEQWALYLDDLHARIAHRFRRPEVKERVQRYLIGLLAEIRRKNGWQMAQTIGEAQPRSTQRILNGTRWDANVVRDDLREYVVEHLGDKQSGVLIVDETGFLKKGEKSVGVGRRYTVAKLAGKWENCQIGVFAAYASEKGSALVDRELYLPHEWADDPERRSEKPVCPRTCASPPKAGLPGSCSNGLSTLAFRRDGSLRTPSTGPNRSSAAGSKSATNIMSLGSTRARGSGTPDDITR